MYRYDVQKDSEVPGIKWVTLAMFLGQIGATEISCEPSRFIVWMAVSVGGTEQAAELKSPDGSVIVSIDVTDEGALSYGMAYRGKPIVDSSVLRSRPIIISLTVDTRSSNPRTIKSNVYS